MIRDKKLWVSDKSRVDLQKLAKQFMDKVDIQLYCSCPADLYWGSQYVRSLKKYDANADNRKETRPPKKRNPKQYGAVCKHLDRLLKALPFYVGTAAQWIKNFYGDDVAKWEDATREEYKWVTSAAAALKKKKEEVPKEEVPKEKPVAKPRKVVKVAPRVEPEKKPEIEPEIEPEELEKEKPEEKPEKEEPEKAPEKEEPKKKRLKKKEEPEKKKSKHQPRMPKAEVEKPKTPEWKPDVGERPEEEYY